MLATTAINTIFDTQESDLWEKVTDEQAQSYVSGALSVSFDPSSQVITTPGITGITLSGINTTFSNNNSTVTYTASLNTTNTSGTVTPTTKSVSITQGVLGSTFS